MRRQAGKLDHDRPHALGQGGRFLGGNPKSRFWANPGYRNERPLLLRQRGEQVEDEGVNVLGL
jgi:hypothetical protein